MNKPIPKWMQAQLEAAGVIDFSKPGPPATRKARTVYCTHCRHGVVRGLLSMPTPWPVDANPQPLTPTGEILALLAGVHTYELHWVYDRYELDHRSTDRIRNHPAATLAFTDILAEHHCGEPADWPTQDTRVPETPIARATQSHYSDEPPF